MEVNIYIQRTDAWTNVYEIYAKASHPPIEDGDGSFIMTIELQPWEESTTAPWTTPDERAYYFRAVPVYRRETSPGSNS